MDRTGVIDAGAEVETEFRKPERHGRCGAHGLTQQRAVVGVNAGGHVDGNHRPAGSIHELDRVAIDAGDFGRQACAK